MLFGKINAKVLNEILANQAQQCGHGLDPPSASVLSVRVGLWKQVTMLFTPQDVRTERDMCPK